MIIHMSWCYAETPMQVRILPVHTNNGETMEVAYYFTGKYGEVGHEDKGAGKEFAPGYPVFFTYDRQNLEEKHNSARFVHSEDAELWAATKNKNREKP